MTAILFAVCTFLALSVGSLAENSNATNSSSSTVVATDPGDWIMTSAPVGESWFQIVTSDSGQYIYASTPDYLFISNDFGNEWIKSSIEKFFADIATNSSGQQVYGVLNFYNDSSLYISSDFGETWTPESSLPFKGTYSSIACSSSGEVVYVVGGGIGIYVSQDSGQTWSVTDFTTVTNQYFFQVVTDATGQYAAAVSGSGGMLITSDDYGFSFVIQDLDSGTNQFTSVQMSSDGKTIMVGDSLLVGGLFLSTNYGVSFTQLVNPPNASTANIAASGDMQFIMTWAYGDPLSNYFSSDGGATWNLTEYSTGAQYTFFTIATSKTGQLFVGGDYGDGVWLYQPACPEGYGHTGFDSQSDPSGSNLCFTCADGQYGEYTADGENVQCISCAAGTYSSGSLAFGADSCTECGYPYSTVDDASHSDSDCHVLEINLPQFFQWVIYSAGFVWFVAVVYYATRPCRLAAEGKNAFLAVFMVLVFPFFDLCTDFAYLMISPFYHVSIFAACVVCFMHPVVFFLLRLCTLRALPTSLRFIWWLGYNTSAGADEGDGEGEEKEDDGHEGGEADFIPYPTITYPCDGCSVVTSRFTLVLAFDVHDNLFTIGFEAVVWCVAVVLQVVSLFALPLCLAVWLVVGLILQLTQTITLSGMWNMWFLVWTGTDEFTDVGKGGVDTEDLNYGILTHFLLEALPSLALQAVNTTLMDSWTTDSVAIMSISMSIIVCMNVLYKYLYHSTIHAEPVGVKHMPIDRSIRVKIMLLSVDWSLLDARLPPYTKQIKSHPRLSEFRYSVEGEEAIPEGLGIDEAVVGPGDLEESLLSGGGKHSSHYSPHQLVEPSASSDISSVSSAGYVSGVSGWTSKSDVADRLLLLFGPESQSQYGGGENNSNEDEQEGSGSDPFLRMLTGAGIPPELQAHNSLTHLDAAVVVELFTENQSLTVFIEELGKFEVPRIISSKLFMHLKSLVKSL